MLVMGFDYGSQKTGVAIGNTLTNTARAIKTITGTQEHRILEIEKCIFEWKPSLLLVGIPLHNGAEQKMSIRCRRFARTLQNRFNMQVILADEQFSSSEARRITSSPHIIDATAAAIVVQAWLVDQVTVNR